MALYYEGGAVSATATGAAKTLTEACTSLVLRNDGANSVYININSATVAASASYFKLRINDSLSLKFEEPSAGITSFAYVCDTAETATLAYAAKRG